ncbi:restriction endonuclease subunit S [Thermodesulfobacteriota bacterium B35]
MAGEWEQVAFADVVELISGGTPKTSIPEYWGGSIPWLSVKDFNTGYRWVSTAEKTITEQGLAESATTILNRGDIIISARGTVGVVAQLALPMAFNQSCYGIRGRQGIAETNFVYYALRHAVSQMQQVAHGGVFNTITRDTFKIIKTKLPPLPEQRAIACILGALDDKIELNRRMNETLEAMARAIFKSWFVDFDPVRAKAEGRQPPGLAPHIADLFPDAFEESELGEIPKGWDVSTVGQHFHLTMGQSPPGSTYNETGEGLPFYQGRRDFGFRFPSRRVFCTAPTRFAEPGDTLVSVRAPVGAVNMASERCAVGRGVAAIRHRSGGRSFTYYSMHHLGNYFGKFEAEGTVFGSINKKDFEQLSFIAPSPEVLTAFDRVVSPLDDRIDTNERQTSILAALRDTLLPRLISGELRLLHAERIVGRCA